MRSNTLNNWLVQMILGFTLIAVSADIAIVFRSHGWPVWLGCGFLFFVAVGILFFAELSERPKRIVRQAKRTLTFPQDWHLKFDKKITRGGVVPVAVKRPDGVRFVIDICAHASVSWGTPTDGSGEPTLVGLNGKRFKPDPVASLIKAAQAASAAPVLWLPQAASPKNLRHPESNLIVVMGSAHDLKHALQGAEIVLVRTSAESQNSAPRVTMSPQTTIAGVHPMSI
jgi:hypothetical protein